MTIVVTFFTILTLAFGLIRLLSVEAEYMEFEFPWYKRPLAIWAFVIIGIIIGLIVQ